jgi:hypothetical protein
MRIASREGIPEPKAPAPSVCAGVRRLDPTDAHDDTRHVPAAVFRIGIVSGAIPHVPAALVDNDHRPGSRSRRWRSRDAALECRTQAPVAERGRSVVRGLEDALTLQRWTRRLRWCSLCGCGRTRSRSRWSSPVRQLHRWMRTQSRCSDQLDGTHGVAACN